MQVGKAAGGYVGSYTIHDESQSAEAQPVYGPPNHKVGQPLGSDFVASDSAKASIANPLPSTSYGIPDTQVINFVMQVKLL